MTLIFKICGKAEWDKAQAVGIYHGSEHDRQDGFIHFSTGSQLPGTLTKHYASGDHLMLIAFEPDALGDALKWEAARGGDLFPHLYAPLPVSLALWVKPLPLGIDGVHALPEEARS